MKIKKIYFYKERFYSKNTFDFIQMIVILFWKLYVQMLVFIFNIQLLQTMPEALHHSPYYFLRDLSDFLP